MFLIRATTKTPTYKNVIVAKEDFCFTYYDGDAARDKAHMTRLERGAYDDIISAQRKRGHLSIEDIKRVLSKDFEECWPSLEWILKKDAEQKFFIEWVDNSLSKRQTWSSKSSDAGIRSARLREARKKGTHSKAEWFALLMEANGVCPRCNNEVPHFDKDHVIPIYKGGSDSIQNIQPLCPKCNAAKGPEETDYYTEQRTSALNKLKSSTNLQPIFNQVLNQSATSNIEYGNGNEDGIENEIKEGGAGETIPVGVVPDMLQEFISTNPDYPSDQLTDFPALRLIAGKILKWQKLKGDITLPENSDQIKLRWGELVPFIRADQHFGGYSILQISKYFQSIVQSFNNVPTVKYQRSNPGGNTTKPGTSEARVKAAKDY